MTVPASENGAGPHHLLPFLPSVCWAFSVMRRQAATRLRDKGEIAVLDGVTLAVLGALVFGYGPMVEISWERSLQFLADGALIQQDAIYEINRTLDDNPRTTVAVGGPTDSYAVRLRVIPVFRGNPLPLDFTAWNAAEALPRVIKECRAELWLLPVNARLDGDFTAHYTLQMSGRLYDQWRCAQK